MAYGSTIEVFAARIGLVSFLAWRAIAELFRRYHPRYDLRVTEIHPGISVRGVLRLTVGVPTASDSPTLSFNLGGPSGTYCVDHPLTTEPGNFAHSSEADFAGPMLARDPAIVVDQIAAAWGLPPAPASLPPSSNTTLAIRVIAGLLERRVFDREPWRTTAGFCGNGAVGDMIPDWLDLLGENSAALRRAAEKPVHNVDARLSRYILVHRAPGENLCLYANDIAGIALAFDLAEATVTELSAEGKGKTVQLRKSYDASGHDLRRLLNQLESSLA